MSELDTMIAQATKEVAAEQKASEPEAQKSEVTKNEDKEAIASTETEDKTEPKESEETKEVEEDISKKPDSELTPEQLAKRERNRESHLKSKLAEQKRQYRELQAKLAQLEQPKVNAVTEPKVQANGKPDPNTFKGTWAEFNEALLDWKLAQNKTESDKTAQESQEKLQVEYTRAKRTEEIISQETEFVKTTPEYADLIKNNTDFLSHLTPELSVELAKADNPTLSIYALMKEGVDLDDLYNLSPERLSIELAKAEIRGDNYLKQKSATAVSNAPKPMAAARGNTGGKSPHNMNPDELLKHYNIKS